MARLLAWTIGASSWVVAACADGLVLNRNFMSLVRTAAHLSWQTFQENAHHGNNNEHDYEYASWTEYENGDDGNNTVRAIVARTKNDDCVVAFRMDNTDLIAEEHYPRNDNSTAASVQSVCAVATATRDDCCHVPTAVVSLYRKNHLHNIEHAVRQCASHQKGRQVVLTGYSSAGGGGADLAAVAALRLADVNPIVVTFGCPAQTRRVGHNATTAVAVAPPSCPIIASQRWYRFVLRPATGTDATTTTVEAITNFTAPRPFRAGPYIGHLILLSQDDANGVAYAGLDTTLAVELWPAATTVVPLMTTAPSNIMETYMNQIKALTSNMTMMPLRTNGFANGTPCVTNAECHSQNCALDHNGDGNQHAAMAAHCRPMPCHSHTDCAPLGQCHSSGFCNAPQSSCQRCQVDADCEHHCSAAFGVCTNMRGLMDNECGCQTHQDCASSRCIENLCHAPLGVGGTCRQRRDCASGVCNWRGQCAASVSSSSSSTSSSSSSSSSASFWDWWLEPTTSSDDDRVSATTRRSAAVVTQLTPAQTKTVVSFDAEATSEHRQLEHHHDIARLRGKRESDSPPVDIIWTGVIVLVVVVALGYIGARWCQQHRNRRRGYEQIPTQLNV